MSKETTEFSFKLQPSNHGIGVFATHDIKNGSFLRLFANENEGNVMTSERNSKNVPEKFHQFCMVINNKLICPKDFGHMAVGWYLNHSNTPNAHHKDYQYYASSDIKEGEEITIDYNTLEEDEDTKDSYYKKSGS
jgi:hypothetical protein